MNQHLSQLEIEQLFADSTTSSAAVQRHLEECAVCRKRVEEVTAGEWWWGEGRQLIVASLKQAEALGTPPVQFNKGADYDPLQVEIEKLVSSFETPTHPELIGRVDGYDIHSLIGVGGMGAVFKGFDQELNRPVAIKFLLPRHSGSGLARQRFSREAKAIAAVRDDNVIPVFRINSSDRYPHFAMPLIAGVSLQRYVDVEGQLEPGQLVQIAIQICAGLQAAHEKGLIHRDVKPANVLLENNCNRVVVTDFGLAREESDSSLTQTGIIAGTPRYMSPEQADGRRLDYRSDLFSLGSVMFFMATGTPPFKGAHQLELLNNIRNSSQPNARRCNPNIPLRLSQAIQRLLSKDPAHRFQSAADVKDFLTQYAAHLNAPELNREPKLERRWRLGRNLTIGLLAVLLAIAIVGFVVAKRNWIKTVSFHSPNGLKIERADTNSVEPKHAGRQSEPIIAPIPMESEAFDSYFADSGNVPTVRGEIVGYDPRDFRNLTVEYVRISPGKLQKTTKLQVDRNGRFELDLEHAFPLQEIGIVLGDVYFGTFMASRDLTIHIDLEQLRKHPEKTLGRGIRFSGIDAAMTEYLYRFSEFSRKRMTQLAMKRSSLKNPGRNATESLKIIADICEQEAEILNDFMETDPSAYSWILKENLKTYQLDGHLSFHIMSRQSPNAELIEECLSHRPSILNFYSTGFYHNLSMVLSRASDRVAWAEAIKSANPTPENATEFAEYFEQVENVRDNKPFDEAIKTAGDKKYLTPNFDTISDSLVASHVKNIKKVEPRKANVLMLMGATGSMSPAKFAESALPHIEDGWCKSLMLEAREKDLNRIDEVRKTIELAMASGNGFGDRILSTDGMHLYESDHESGKAFAESLTNAFPGSAVVVNFWMDSGNELINDIEYSKHYRRSTQGKPVEFVFVCLGAKKQAWMEKVVGLEIPGHHVYLNQRQSRQAKEHFKISVSPTIFWIDEEGNYDSNLERSDDLPSTQGSAPRESTKNK